MKSVETSILNMPSTLYNGKQRLPGTLVLTGEHLLFTSTITIQNHLGQQVLHLPEQVLHEPVLSIDLSQRQLPDGIYTLTVKSMEGKQTKQFIISR